MSLFGRHLNFGLAFTEEGGSCLRLARSGDAWRILALDYISWRNEGLTDAGEVRKAALEWMRDLDAFHPSEVCCLLPQNIANTVISDFPPVHENAKLAKMVAYQTQQLAGLSGTSLVNGFQEVAPMPGQTNPMLIAVAPQDELEKWSDFYRGGSVDVSKLVPAGLALYNAFAVLQENDAAESGLQGILECGEKSSILVINWQSRIQAIQLLDIPQHDPVVFGKAVLSALRAWTNTQLGDGRLAHPEKIWLSGALAATDGFLEGVAETTALPVQLLGLPARSCPQGTSAGPVKNGVYPAMSLAFGLAAQKLGIAPIGISLLPDKLSWQRKRVQEFPFLVMAALLLVCFLTWIFFNSAKDLYLQEIQLTQQEAFLDNCLATAPKLKQSYQELQTKQLQILPIVEASLRTKRFVSSVQTWYDAIPIPKRDSWCIYLADEFSFAEDNAQHRNQTNANPRRDNRPQLPTTPSDALNILGNTPATSVGSHGEDTLTTTPVMPSATPVQTIPLLTRMYAGGILPATNVKYQAMKDFQGELNRSDTFINVDDYSDFLSKDFVEMQLSPWNDFLKTYKNILKKDYTLFFLQLPFLEAPVQLPASLPPPSLQ